jgi:hypothetical protein
VNGHNKIDKIIGKIGKIFRSEKRSPLWRTSPLLLLQQQQQDHQFFRRFDFDDIS